MPINKAQPPNPLAGTPCLPGLLAEWDALATEKWREIRRRIGHFISVYSPQWTMREDLHRRHETRREMMKWTEAWFAKRGVLVTAVPETGNADGFAIAVPNNRAEWPA